MKRFISIFFLIFIHFTLAYGDDAREGWNAGEIVAEQLIEKSGVDKWFSESEISDEVFARINGKSWRNGAPERKELRYLRVLHRDEDGNIRIGELICNKLISSDLLEIFRALYEASYPIERIELIDNYNGDDELSMEVNNTSAFNYRKVAGSAKLSAHALGMAVDINPKYNPEVKGRPGSLRIRPAGGKNYADRSKQFRYKIDRGDLCHRLFKSRGFSWGGDWRSSKDYQHFEKKM